MDVGQEAESCPKIPGTDEAWDERLLGADERYVVVVEDDAAALADN
ncbi:hypothetical protein NRY68_10990 [Acidithiobacillus ferrooxidans]|nr:hypothetical protein [Acidithiobacillus ferrooxidans]MCR1346301.1 hypothetical protein [Acidithiobacillus ferrooxidans]MCR1354394.1 hypothetical protein [Acidithiobacillus ferrooxidans]